MKEYYETKGIDKEYANMEAEEQTRLEQESLHVDTNIENSI